MPDGFSTQYRDGLDMVIDAFAGGGGASTGIELAIGRPVDVAVNHDVDAIAMHEANHPLTRHYITDVWDVKPEELAIGRRVSMMWFSPDCTHHSRARGGKPRDTGRRALADIIPRWCRVLLPDVFFMENVEEWLQWGPLDDADRPIKGREGESFREWLTEVKSLGYVVEWRVLKACDYGAPTIRKRLFLVARRDGQPIVWPDATHGAAPLIPYRAAAECIDWNEPVCSIFATRMEAKMWAKRHKRGVPVRPLADNTLARIARGVDRFVLNDADPFIVPITHSGDPGRVHSIREPLRTITTAHGGEFAVAVPMIIPTGFGERPTQAPRIHSVHDPLTTVCAGGAKQNLCLAFLAKHFTGVTGIPMRKPMGTVTSWDHHSLVTASMQLTLRNNADCRDMRDLIPTVTAGGGHIAEVRAFMIEYYGNGESRSPRGPMATVTTHDRFGIVTVAGHDYQIYDIGMRMLTPRELARAQGFPDDYRLDVGDGIALTKERQIHMIGNSVSPPMAAAIVAANRPRPRAALAA